LITKEKKYKLKFLDSVTMNIVDNQWKRKVRLYNKSEFRKAYKSGIFFDNYKGQVTSLLVDMYAKTTEEKVKIDNLIPWKILLKPPVISSVKRFTTPHDDLAAPTVVWAKDLHRGSVMHVIGRYFGNTKPKVWLEYITPNGRIKMARCKVLRYKPYADRKNRTGHSYMDLVPKSATYSASELKVRLPTKWPKDWDFGVNYKLIIDNGVGKASIGSFTTVASAASNDAPTAVDDIFNGANAIARDSKKNELDILDNDIFPNADYVDVKIISPADAGGKAKWDKNRGILIYTPRAGFSGLENLIYQITEKYTDQKAISTATVQITVQ
jgi:hypothetical protein